MKILITNIVALNGGDAAIMYGMVVALRKAFGADIEIHIYASEPIECKKLYPEFIFRETLGLKANRASFSKVRVLGRILRMIQRYRYLSVSKLYGSGLKFFSYILPKEDRISLHDYASADIIVSSGGTYLIEPYGLITQYTDYSICYNLKKKVCFYTQSLGPFTRSHTIKWMRSVFSDSPCILVRDQRSYNHINDLAIIPSPNVIKIADAAFSLAQQQDLDFAINRKLPKSLKVAISVREWEIFQGRTKEEGMEVYRYSLSVLVKHLVECGHEVCFFSTCQGLENYTDDSKEAEEILKLLPKQIACKVQIQYEYVHFTEIMKQLRNVDLLVATRLHMSILSLIVGTPVLPIAYEFKTKELFTTLNLEDYVIPMDTISPETLVEKYMNFVDNVDTFRSTLFKQVQVLSSDAISAASYIKNVLR